MPISAPDFKMLELPLPSPLIKDNAKLQGEITCQRFFHFLPLQSDADWSEKFPEDECSRSQDQSLPAAKTECSEAHFCCYCWRPLPVSWVQSAMLAQANPPLWSCKREGLHFPFCFKWVWPLIGLLWRTFLDQPHFCHPHGAWEYPLWHLHELLFDW